ncbi:hypothetical protein X743_33465 [Mesorhizobium sp. LNHC252B00]|nr:hypothetical protein X743_33465 [Mesorhizobium sp. LNHC252B00]
MTSPRARVILGGVEMVHMMRKNHAMYASDEQLSLAAQFRAARRIKAPNGGEI